MTQPPWKAGPAVQGTPRARAGDAMALWDDALRRAGMAGASPDASGSGSSTSQQLLARGSGPGRPGEVSGSSSLPLALSRARGNTPQR